MIDLWRQDANFLIGKIKKELEHSFYIERDSIGTLRFELIMKHKKNDCKVKIESYHWEKEHITISVYKNRKKNIVRYDIEIYKFSFDQPQKIIHFISSLRKEVDIQELFKI